MYLNCHISYFSDQPLWFGVFLRTIKYIEFPYRVSNIFPRYLICNISGFLNINFSSNVWSKSVRISDSCKPISLLYVSFLSGLWPFRFCWNFFFCLKFDFFFVNFAKRTDKMLTRTSYVFNNVEKNPTFWCKIIFALSLSALGNSTTIYSTSADTNKDGTNNFIAKLPPIN